MEENFADNISVHKAAVNTLYAASNLITWEMVKEATAKNETLTHLKEIVASVMSELSDLHQDIRAYHRHSSQLYEVDGVVMMKNRIVVPTALREYLLQSLQAAHQGIWVMCQRAANSIFWPNISADITRIRNECEHIGWQNLSKWKPLKR